MKIKSIFNNIFALLWKTITRFDLFSQKIQLTYKGESSFSTFLGGFVSIIIFTIVGIYSGFLLQVMTNRQNANNSKSTAVVDLNIRDEDYYPFDYGFAFGVTITDTDGMPLVLDPTYFTLQISENTFIKINGYYTPKYSDLGYKLWDATDMPGMNAEYLARGLSSSMYCPVNKRYRVSGNYMSSNYHYVSIILK